MVESAAAKAPHRARRVRACILLRDACGGDLDAEDYARAVEAGVHRGRSLAEYGGAISALVHALQQRPGLRAEHADGAVLATLTPRELQTDRARERVEGLRAEERARKEGLTRVRVAEGRTRCRRCGGRDIVFYQRQTRSADEPATVFYQCQTSTCMARWRG